MIPPSRHPCFPSAREGGDDLSPPSISSRFYGGRYHSDTHPPAGIYRRTRGRWVSICHLPPLCSITRRVGTKSVPTPRIAALPPRVGIRPIPTPHRLDFSSLSVKEGTSCPPPSLLLKECGISELVTPPDQKYVHTFFHFLHRMRVGDKLSPTPPCPHTVSDLKKNSRPDRRKNKEDIF